MDFEKEREAAVIAYVGARKEYRRKLRAKTLTEHDERVLWAAQTCAYLAWVALETARANDGNSTSR